MLGYALSSEVSTGIAVAGTISLALLSSYLGRSVLVAFLMSLLVAVNIASIQVTEVFGLQVTTGTPLYAVTFLVSNIISERYGNKAAHRAVNQGFVATAAFVIVGYLTLLIHGMKPEIETALRSVLLRSSRILAASFATYIVVQHTNVAAYKFIRQRYGEDFILLRNNVTDIVAEMLDSTMFFALAFIGTPEKWWKLAFSGFLLKSIIGLLNGPVVKIARKLGTAKRLSQKLLYRSKIRDAPVAEKPHVASGDSSQQ